MQVIEAPASAYARAGRPESFHSAVYEGGHALTPSATKRSSTGSWGWPTTETVGRD